MRATRLTLTALTAIPLLAAAAPAGAAPAGAATVVPPEYIINFAATTGPVSTAGITFQSTRCAIGPALDPLVVACTETGTIKLTPTGGAGTAKVSSAIAGINWTFKLVRSSAVSPSVTYKMTGTGTESMGSTGIIRPIRVTGTITSIPAAAQSFSGTEDVYLALPPAA